MNFAEAAAILGVHPFSGFTLEQEEHICEVLVSHYQPLARGMNRREWAEIVQAAAIGAASIIPVAPENL